MPEASQCLKSAFCKAEGWNRSIVVPFRKIKMHEASQTAGL